MRIRERLGQALFERVAGPDGPKHRQRIHGTPGPRWFPQGSPITVVHGDASMYVGGIRAVLLQTMQPRAMTAVAEHSGYRGDMWGRLARTSRYLAVTTFGTVEDAQQAVDAVRAIHDRVHGTMPDGTTYDANDPHLLTWVHVAEIQSFLLAHRRFGAHPLDQAGYDEYVAQAAFVSRKLGAVDPPTSEAELHAAVERFRPELRAIDHARDAVSYLIHQPELPWLARPPYRVLVAAAIGLMPDWTREPLALPTLPVAHDRVADALGRAATRTVRWATAGDRALAVRLRAQASVGAAAGSTAERLGVTGTTPPSTITP
ncbi:MAG TPA: oxygenase MpaB family protein [Nocardioides sp.]|nr:oxygenase MpaB family protein [Nocardioides sp.]